MKILITGASGFIGSFIVEEGLRRGYEVWAGIRRNSSRMFLQDKRIKFIELDLDNKENLKEQLSEHTLLNDKWDYIVHAAGVTKCIDKNDFMRVNYIGTKNFIDTLQTCKITPKKFIYLSSLSIFGPVKEKQPYKPITEHDKPRPDTVYGKSKLEAEKYIIECKKLQYIILRPTGVYGPRERDYFKMVQSINNHIDFSVGYKPQLITFIYVKDLVKAIYMVAESNVSNRCYFVSEPQGYDSRSFSNYIQEELNKKNVLHIKAPLWVLKIISSCAEIISSITKKANTLNNDKYNIMKQRNWLCDTTPIEQEIGFNIDYDLHAGTKEMIQWYKKEKWL